MLRVNAMPPDSPPLISVIVVCKNPGTRLHSALASVWNQRGVQPELIVVDGASTDGTVPWLESRRAQIATLISEPDNGVYAAMNKGLAAARGEWVLFLGSDDELGGEIALSEMLAFLRSTGSGVVVGETGYRDGRVYRLAAAPRPIARNFVHHQGAFYRRTLFLENGGFDGSLAIMADYDFNLRLWKNHVRFKPASLRIATCSPGGLSDAGRWRGYREEIGVRHRHFAAWRCVAWDALTVIRYLRKKILRSLASD
ncbi:MAG: glycosyl transferase family 2 [Verrucomicrobia bacterium]|nr:glycosyl transferase family 2 [Verrucomicrobiota bacterium]